MYMISLESLLLEGRYDSLVRQLSNELLRTVKQSHEATKQPEGMFAGEKIYWERVADAPAIKSEDYPAIYFKEVNNETIPLEFYLSLRVQWIGDLADYGIDAGAYNEKGRTADIPAMIEIELEMNPNDVPQIYNKVAMDLRDSIRHEIEHLTQSGWNLKPSKYVRSDQSSRDKIEAGELPQYRYLILPAEIPAMLHGLYMKAKKSKTPFKKVINDFLDKVEASGNITLAQKQIVFKKWQSYQSKLNLGQTF